MKIAPCTKRGAQLGIEECAKCGGKRSAFVYACEAYGKCQIGQMLDDVASCRWDCPQRVAPPGEPQLVEVVAAPPTGRAAHSHEAHRAELLALLGKKLRAVIPEFESAVASIPASEPPSAQQGVVYVAGGWRFFPSLWVSIKMLRESGCTWPITVYYFRSRGEFSPEMADLLPDVSWVPIESLCPAPFRDGTEGGWQAKPLALLHSPYRRTLYLDADCYPIRNPVAALESISDAAFWPDIAAGPGIMTAAHFQALGMEYADARNWETGQILVDKSHEDVRRALWLATWLAFRPESRQWSYGDCGCFQMAFRRVGAPYWMHAGRPGSNGTPAKWDSVAFVHIGPDAAPLFVHRCRDKFRLVGHATAYNTPQTAGDAQGYFPHLPGEESAQSHYRDLLARINQRRWEADGKTATQITATLAVGGYTVFPQLAKAGWHCLLLANGAPEVDGPHLRLPLIDGTGNSVAALRRAVLWVVDRLEIDQKVAVLCRSGANRAPAIAAGALCELGKFPTHREAYDFVATQRFEVGPYGGTAQEVAKALYEITVGT